MNRKSMQRPPLHNWSTARLDLITTPNLKAEAKAQGLKVSGTRQQLIDRLRTLTTQAPKSESVALSFMGNPFYFQDLTPNEYNALIQQIMTPGTLPTISELPAAPPPKIEDPLLRLTRDQLLAEIRLHPGIEKTGIKEVLVERIRQMQEPALTEPVRAILQPQLQPQIQPELDVDPLESLTVPQLKEELKAQSLKVSGTKAELIQRLRAMPNPAITLSVQRVITLPRVPKMQVARWILMGGQIQNLPPGQTLPQAQINVLPIPQVAFPPKDPLEVLTVAQLKAELKAQGLAVGGNKSELIRRLHQREPMTQPVRDILTRYQR